MDDNIIKDRIKHLKMAILAIEEIASNNNLSFCEKSFYGLVKNFMGNELSDKRIEEILKSPLSVLFDIKEERNEATLNTYINKHV